MEVVIARPRRPDAEVQVDLRRGGNAHRVITVRAEPALSSRLRVANTLSGQVASDLVFLLLRSDCRRRELEYENTLPDRVVNEISDGGGSGVALRSFLAALYPGVTDVWSVETPR